MLKPGRAYPHNPLSYPQLFPQKMIAYSHEILPKMSLIMALSTNPPSILILLSLSIFIV